MKEESILEKLVRSRAEAPKKCSEAELEARIAELPPCRDFAGALREKKGKAVIAELKKASPSKGMIREDFRPVELAVELEKAGAAALSVLTEPNCFLGSLHFLEEVRKHVELPLLRLIAAALDKQRFAALHRFARSLGLAVLCEAHSKSEVEMLAEGGGTIIGINARDLSDFSVSVERSLNLVGEIPSGLLRIAESGIRSASDIRRFREEGADGFLIGETLMRALSPGEKLKELLA